MRFTYGLVPLSAVLLVPPLLSAPAEAASAPPRPETKCTSKVMDFRHRDMGRFGVRVCWTVQTHVKDHDQHSHTGRLQVLIRNLTKNDVSLDAAMRVLVGGRPDLSDHPISCPRHLKGGEVTGCNIPTIDLPSGTVTQAGVIFYDGDRHIGRVYSPFITVPLAPDDD